MAGQVTQGLAPTELKGRPRIYRICGRGHLIGVRPGHHRICSRGRAHHGDPKTYFAIFVSCYHRGDTEQPRVRKGKFLCAGALVTPHWLLAAIMLGYSRLDMQGVRAIAGLAILL